MKSAATAPRIREFGRANPISRQNRFALVPRPQPSGDNPRTDLIPTGSGEHYAEVNRPFVDLVPMDARGPMGMVYNAGTYIHSCPFAYDWSWDLAEISNWAMDARVLGHYYTPELSFWRDVTSASLPHHVGIAGVGALDAGTLAWFSVPGAATWEGCLRADDADNFVARGARAQVLSAIRAARNEQFESGYESELRKELGRLFGVFGAVVLEALYDALRLPGVASDVTAQGFKFLVDIADPTSRDSRLVFIAEFLRNPSPTIRDAAASALAALGDSRGASYLRQAAQDENHPTLKYEFLEIAVELAP